MEAKNIILVGLGLAVVGGGAYFYFNNKKKPSAKELVDKLTSDTSSTNQAPAPTPTQSVDSVLATAPIVNPDAPVTNQQSAINVEVLAKFNQAQGLATQISTLKMQFKYLQTSNGEGCNFDPPLIGQDKGKIENWNTCMKTASQIRELRTQIKMLGYKDINGLAVKL
jgi:hypothetical protein